jgi:succinate dehydrogenase / fumarate reductase membrane anchor subunit
MSQSSSAPRQASLRSPLGRARGAGSAKSGASQWWAQRVTSVALLPLTVWFILSMASSAGMTHAEAQAWIGRPLNAVLLIALIILTFRHAAAGVQEIIEDYVKAEWMRIAALLAVKGAAWLLGIAGVFAVLRIAV